MTNNNDSAEYIYGEVLLDSEQEVQVAGSINRYLTKEHFIDDEMVKLEDRVTLGLGAMVQMFGYVAKQVYEPQLRALKEQVDSQLKVMEQKQASNQVQLDNLNKINQQMAQDVAEHQVDEQNILKN